MEHIGKEKFQISTKDSYLTLKPFPGTEEPQL